MRAFDGQFSDNVAIRRTREQKRLLLAQLRQELAGLKPTVTPAIRTAMTARIADLEREMQESSAPKAGREDKYRS